MFVSYEATTVHGETMDISCSTIRSHVQNNALALVNVSIAQMQILTRAKVVQMLIHFDHTTSKACQLSPDWQMANRIHNGSPQGDNYFTYT